jgi:hypothetical protein
MQAIRALDVRKDWREGQSDQIIDSYRQNLLRLRSVALGW